MLLQSVDVHQVANKDGSLTILCLYFSSRRQRKEAVQKADSSLQAQDYFLRLGEKAYLSDLLSDVVQ